MKDKRGIARTIAASVVLFWLGAGPLGAQTSPPAAPDANAAEILVKSSLMTLNDANLTGNYAVFHARFHPAQQPRVSVQLLTDVFARFRNDKNNFEAVVAMKPVYTEGPSVDRPGMLKMKGHFDTRPQRITFDLAYVREGEEWRLLRILINVVRAPQQ